MSAGKAAYEAFAIGRNGYDPGFRFEGLSDESRAVWEVAAQAAIDWYKTNNVVVPESTHVCEEYCVIHD